MQSDKDHYYQANILLLDRRVVRHSQRSARVRVRATLPPAPHQWFTLYPHITQPFLRRQCKSGKVCGMRIETDWADKRGLPLNEGRSRLLPRRTKCLTDQQGQTLRTPSAWQSAWEYQSRQNLSGWTNGSRQNEGPWVIPLDRGQPCPAVIWRCCCPSTKP